MHDNLHLTIKTNLTAELKSQLYRMINCPTDIYMNTEFKR